MRLILAIRAFKLARSSLSVFYKENLICSPSRAGRIQCLRFIGVESRQLTSPSASRSSKRTHTCNEVTEKHLGQKVTLCGWLQFKRMNFALLRDGYGVTQVVLTNDLCQLIENTQTESVLQVQGTVVRRPEGQARSDMLTGQVEIVAENIEVLNQCRSDLPFRPRDYQKKTEAVRLKYRYLDLRHVEMQRNLRLRSELTHAFRSRLIEEYGFCEVETPTLFRRTPGGAKEFPVACHSHPHEFYSLTQSPQQFKQLLMVGSMDRYFQVARCYRDEGARSDRQPEFTQVDIEMSFVTMGNLMKLLEDLVKGVWPTRLSPFSVITYKEAMAMYGSDKPDLRYDIVIEDAQDLLPSVHDSLPSGHCVKALRLTNGFEVVKPKHIKEWRSAAEQFSLNCISEVIVREDGTVKSPVAKLINKDKFDRRSVTIVAWGPENSVFRALGKVRTEFAQISGLLQGKENEFKFAWIVDFPLFSKDNEGNLVSEHHPFTAPHCGHVHLLENDPLNVLGQHFDLVLNGWEVGGGSIRIHSSSLQRKIIKDLLHEDCSELEHLLEALQSGAPPHGGFAFGLDRLICILCGTPSIRDVIAFPKSHEGRDLMAAAPTKLSDDDLEFFHLQRLKPNMKPDKNAAVG